MKIENQFNNYKDKLTDKDIDSIIETIGYRCWVNTLNRLRGNLTYSASQIPSYGIMDRLYKTDKGDWHYCAGQSYPDEIRTVREIILKLK